MNEKVSYGVGLRLFERREAYLQSSCRLQNAALQGQIPFSKRFCRLLGATKKINETLDAFGNLWRRLR